MINVAELMTDPDFVQPFDIERVTGTFGNEGEFVTDHVVLPRIGAIQPSRTADIMNFVPEGERTDNAITIYTGEEVQIGDGVSREPDVIVWKGNRYKAQFSKPWQFNGYWFVIATGISL